MAAVLLVPAMAGTVVVDQIPRAVPVWEDGSRPARPSRATTPPPLRITSTLPVLLPLALEAGGGEEAVPAAGPKDVLVTQDDPARRWRLRLDYFRGTENGFGGLLGGDIDAVTQDGFALHLGYRLVEDLWGWPLDLIVQGAVLWHDEKGWQDNFLHYTAALKGEWTAFPWNDHLRTRLGFASGWSYADKIPFAEVNNRGSLSSKHFLHYLEPSLSLNCGDLFRLIRFDHLFTGFDSASLDRAWLVGSVYHRSGAWGFYGKDHDGNEITGGSNYLAIGIQAEF